MKDWQLIQRLEEVLVDCDNGKITDNQAIRKLMKSVTKYHQSKFNEEEKKI